MGQLFDTIRQRVLAGRYVIGQHAAERLDERGVLEWQAVDGIEDGERVLERPDASPNPAVEVDQYLTDGTPVKAVWSYLVSADAAKLVTVHFYDDGADAHRR